MAAAVTEQSDSIVFATRRVRRVPPPPVIRARLRRALRFALLQIVLLAATLVQPAEAQRGWSALSGRFDAFARAAGIVGGSAVLVREGRIAARHHYGHADRAAGRRAGDSTLYHWASVTKTLTAIAVLQLRDRGLLSLDDPVTRWVPELRAIHDPDGAVERVTLRMLLSHSSGFQAPTWPWDRGEPWEPFEPTAWSQLVAMMPYQRLEFPPGARYGYSNPGYIYLARVVEKLTNYEDASDFDINNMLFAYTGGYDLPADYLDVLEERIVAFKYWWTEPTPEGIVDDQFYWTENHQIIFLANEYIAGQTFPDTEFTNSGMTGAEHLAHAEPLIRRWIELRARFGFSEWLSNVYFGEDLKGLLLLADRADDPEIARLAAMALDMGFVEVAAHTQAGAFGATHGRSYMKDKMTALDEDTFSLMKMVADDTAYDYQAVDDGILLATARRYRPPEVVRRIARSDETSVVRQRQSLPLDPTEPYTADPQAPYGLDYDDPDNLMVWWGIGSQFGAWAGRHFASPVPLNAAILLLSIASTMVFLVPRRYTDKLTKAPPRSSTSG